MESAYNKNQLLRNKLERYFFDRRDAESSNFRWKCVEGSPRARRFSRYRAKCELNGWVSSHGNLARRKDVLALMHTVRGKIVNRITWNVMGMHGEFSCSFSVVRRTWFYEIVHDACRGTLTDIFRISVVVGELDLRAQFVDRLRVIHATRLFPTKEKS